MATITTEKVDIAVTEDTTEVGAQETSVIDVAVTESGSSPSAVPLEVSVAAGSPQVDVVVSDATIEVAITDGTPVIIEVAGTQGPPGVPEDEVPYDVESDTADAQTTYVGQAAPGTASSAAAWRIKRITDTGSAVSIDWANGSDAFDQVWDDRASLTYGP